MKYCLLIFQSLRSFKKLVIWINNLGQIFRLVLPTKTDAPVHIDRAVDATTSPVVSLQKHEQLIPSSVPLHLLWFAYSPLHSLRSQAEHFIIYLIQEKKVLTIMEVEEEKIPNSLQKYDCVL